MSSMEVLQNGQLESFDSSEFSLIPEQPPLDTDVANHPVNGQLDVSNMQSAFRSAAFDLSVEDIQTRLVELVEDNETMKEALKLNNAVMKEQLSTISAWHNQMTTSMSQQQLSLTNAKARVLELEKENEELKEKIKELQKNPNNVADKNSSIKHSSVVVIDEEPDFEIISERRNTQDEELLKNQLRDSSLKIAELQDEIDKQNCEIIELKKQSAQQISEVESLQQKLNEQRSTNFLQEIVDIQTTPKVVQGLDEAKVAALESKCEELQKKLTEYQLLEKSEAFQRESSSLEAERKVRELEERLAREQHASDLEKLRHKETSKLLSALQANYDRVTKLLQIQAKDQKGKSEEENEYEMQTRQFLEQIDSLTAKLFDMEQTLEERDEKMKQLTAQLETLKADSETVPILKAQVEVYKTDLDNMMLARDSAHVEVERLTRQIQDIQSGSSFCSKCGPGGATGAVSSMHARKKKIHLSRQPESPQLIICPVCQFGFTDLQAAENHVNNCIDKAL